LRGVKISVVFKHTYTIRHAPADFYKDTPWTFASEDNTLFRAFSRSVGDNKPKELCCDIEVIAETRNSIIQKTLSGLSRGILAIDNTNSDQLPYSSLTEVIVDKNGKIKDRHLIPLSITPVAYQDFQKQIDSKISGAASNFASFLFWFHRRVPPANPLSMYYWGFSLNKTDWHYTPRNTSGRVIGGRQPAAVSMKEVARSYRNHTPVAHHLMGEASRGQLSEPQSALLIAVSALEAATKAYISALIPRSDLILEKMPSPSLLSLLQDVIPSIHSKTGVRSEFLPLEASNAKYLKKWVSKRNEIAHGRPSKLERDDLEDFIEFSLDILYILDHARGEVWALDKVSKNGRFSQIVSNNRTLLFRTPGLSRDKSRHCLDGRACHPAAPQARRSSGQRPTGPLLFPHPPGRRVSAPAQAVAPRFSNRQNKRTTSPARSMQTGRSAFQSLHWSD